jgi:manganese oxidase
MDTRHTIVTVYQFPKGGWSMTSSLRSGRTKLIVPNLDLLPYELRHGIKRFRLVAEEVTQTFTNEVEVCAWGYNGSSPGPVMVVQQGEHIQVEFTNHLPERTSIHWHGLIVPNDIDGVPQIGAGPVVEPGKTVVYDFVIRQAGTFMYHAHVMNAQQEAMGLAGMIVSFPPLPTADREYALMLQEWAVQKGEGSGNVFKIKPMSMDFDYFTINGKVYPDTSPLRVRYGETVRIRLGNLSQDSHPMHLHGHEFSVVAADGNRVIQPLTKNTINVAPGETWDIEFQANNAGTWAFHCHKPHHMANEHTSKLGGMFTTVKYV